MSKQISLGLILKRNYNPFLTIMWNGKAAWASALYEDREGRKRFRVTTRNKQQFYPLVSDCEIPELKGEENNELSNL